MFAVELRERHLSLGRVTEREQTEFSKLNVTDSETAVKAAGMAVSIVTTSKQRWSDTMAARLVFSKWLLVIMRGFPAADSVRDIECCLLSLMGPTPVNVRFSVTEYPTAVPKS